MGAKWAAKQAGKDLAGTAQLWFRRTLGLAPTDPRYLDATPHDILAEYWAYHYDDMLRAGKSLEDEVEDPDYNAEVEEFLADAKDDDFEDVP